jgi:hypothetical protein
MTLSSRERATTLQAEFEALPIGEDGSVRVPPAMRTAILNLALDALNEGGEKARVGTPRILAMLTRKPA